MKLPVQYGKLSIDEKRIIREEYIKLQDGHCMFCAKKLDGPPAKEVTDKPIMLKLFPKGFLTHPVHLQHNHDTGWTEGAVHAYCNAVMWQYYGR